MPGWAPQAGWFLVKIAKTALETDKGSSAERQNFKALAKML